jgi:hypothetical protein
MNLKESHDFMARRRKRPSGMVLASNTPFEINQVVLCGRWRLRITQALTQAEFLRRHRENRQGPDAVSGMVPLDGARARLEESEEAADAPADWQYFYAAEVHR